MDSHSFDNAAKRFALRRSRRSLLGSGLAAGGAGLAALALGAASQRVDAQDATPAPGAEETGTGVEFLFVQVFEHGTFAPHPEQADLFTVTLDHGSAQTIYFSDRPERIVGTVPTRRFLDGLGFTPANPPNAALVAQTDDGEDVIVVELLNPRLTETFGVGGSVTLTYDVRVINDYRGDGLGSLAEAPVDGELPASFGPASLFIDDCSDQEITCCTVVEYRDGAPYCANVAGTIGPVGFCWHFGDFCCHPCANDGLDDPQAYWNQQCLQQFPSCGAYCTAFMGGSCW